MSRWLAPLLAIVLWLGLSLSSQAQSPVAEVAISGGDLPHSVQLATVDADAFQRRVNLPPRLDDPPAASGDSYTVTSTYWDGAVKREDGQEEKLDVADDATYYPHGGFVKARLGDEDVWLVIDLRQRAILDRYIRLTRDGALSQQPDALHVLASAAKDETLGVQIGDRTLTAAETQTFWSLASDLELRDVPKNPDFVPPPPGRDIVWVTVTMTEGRDIRFLYSAVTGVLVEPVAQSVYPVPAEWLSPILGEYDRSTIGDALSDGEIEQQAPAGSRWWWPTMIGGGLAAIGAAVWWQRRTGGD